MKKVILLYVFFLGLPYIIYGVDVKKKKESVSRVQKFKRGPLKGKIRKKEESPDKSLIYKVEDNILLDDQMSTKATEGSTVSRSRSTSPSFVEIKKNFPVSDDKIFPFKEFIVFSIEKVEALKPDPTQGLSTKLSSIKKLYEEIDFNDITKKNIDSLQIAFSNLLSVLSGKLYSETLKGTAASEQVSLILRLLRKVQESIYESKSTNINDIVEKDFEVYKKSWAYDPYLYEKLSALEVANELVSYKEDFSNQNNVYDFIRKEKNIARAVMSFDPYIFERDLNAINYNMSKEAISRFNKIKAVGLKKVIDIINN